MSNVTLAIPDDVLRRARIRALHEDTSVNALIRDYLTAYAAEDTMRQAVADLIAMRELSTASSGPEGRTWTRDDLYSDRIRA